MNITEDQVNDIAQKLQAADNDVIFFMRSNNVLPLQYRVLINARPESIVALVMHLVKANPANRDIIVHALKNV